MPMPRRRPDLATGVEQDVPYDQTGLAGADTPQMADPGVGAPDPSAGAAPPPDMGGMDQGAPPMDLGGMASDPSMAPPAGGGAPPDLTGGTPPSPEDLQVEQMAAALEDPSVPPDQKMQIQQQLALAARRQLAGLGQ
jgi:hypothetical protein